MLVSARATQLGCSPTTIYQALRRYWQRGQTRLALLPDFHQSGRPGPGYTALVRSYGLRQEFITPHCPQQNGMVERVIRTLKEQCAHRHRFESLQHASRVIGDWIRFYNHRRPHQALNMKTPAEAFALAA
jgi:putative transposase